MRTSLLLAVAACVALLGVLTGCERASVAAPAAPAPPVAKAAPDAAGPAAESDLANLPVGNDTDEDGNYLCMVKGIPITDLSTAQTVVYDGVLFYLHCPGSKRKFEANPDGYISGEIERVDCGGNGDCEEDRLALEQAAREKAAAESSPTPESAPGEKPKAGE